MDARGTLRHVMGRGIERTKIFRNRVDREDFLTLPPWHQSIRVDPLSLHA